MNYTDNPKPDTDAIEVAEPATMYYGGRSAIAEPDWASEADHDSDWDDDEPLTPEQAAAIKRDPEFIAWEQEVIQKLLESEEDVKAGRVYPFKEAMRDFWRKVENGQL